MALTQAEVDYINTWVSSEFLFSKEGWAHFGCLGVIGEYVLHCLNGNILEIGVGESSIYLTALAKKFNRRIFHCDILDYFSHYKPLKGVFLEDNCIINVKSDINYSNIQGILFHGSSDDFFNKIKFPPIALAFIDGYHSYEQVKKDFFNVLPYVEDNGFILLHDTYPSSAQYIDKGCYDSYKLRQELEQDIRFDCLTLTMGTALNLGLTIIRKKPENRPYFQQ